METATIQIKVSSELAARYGIQALAERLERLLAWEDLQLKALKLKAFLDEHGLNHDEIAEEARNRAWEIYKYTIKDKLPPEAFEQL